MNKVWALERPWPFSSARWKERKDALCMKNIAKADSPKSAMEILPPRPLRGSGKAAHTALRPERSDGKSSIPRVNHFPLIRES